jgi:hypothetical protein
MTVSLLGRGKILVALWVRVLLFLLLFSLLHCGVSLMPGEVPILPIQTAVWDLGMPAVGEKVSLNFSLTPLKVVLVDILEENDFQFTEIVPDPETGLTFQMVIDDIAGAA